MALEGMRNNDVCAIEGISWSSDARLFWFGFCITGAGDKRKPVSPFVDNAGCRWSSPFPLSMDVWWCLRALRREL